MRVATAGILFGLALSGLPLAAQSQSAAAGTVPSQTFKSWTLDCLVPKTGEGAGKQVCFIHYEAHDKTDAAAIAARVVVRRGGADRKLALIIQLPPNSVQASGISLAIDASKPYPVPIQACLPKFCYGAIELTADLENGAKAGQQMNLGFAAKDKGAQQVIVPLAGITAALAALVKTGA